MLSKCHSMVSNITLTSTMTSITTQSLANLTTLLRQHGQTSFMPQHQCACFSADPCHEHGEDIVFLVRYLLKTCHLGIKFAPNQTKSLEYYVDADFCRNWINGLHLLISALPSQSLIGLSSMPIALLGGLPNCGHRLHFLPPKLNTLLCLLFKRCDPHHEPGCKDQES